MSGYFSDLPDSVRLPFTYTEFDPSQADRSLAMMSFNILVIGQQFTGEGLATPLEQKRITTAEQAARFYGRGSMLSEMASAFLVANTVSKLTCIGVADYDGGVAATGSIKFGTDASTVTTPVPVCLYIGGKLCRAATSLGMGQEAITEAVANAINADPTLPVTALKEAVPESDPAQWRVALTARHKGTGGNDIDLRFGYQGEDFPGGFDAQVTPMSGGAGNPDPVDAIMAMGNTRFHMIAWPWDDVASLTALRDELEARWGPLRQNDGQAVIVRTGPFDEVVTFTEDRNDKHLTVFPSEGSPTLPWVDCAASVGVLSRYGEDDPARPFQTLTIPGVLPPAEKDQWSSFPEKNQALYSGCSVRGVTPEGKVMFLNVITTHRFNAWGAETSAYLQLNSLLTLSFMRYDWNNYIQLKFPRYKLADDDQVGRVNPGQPIMTPSMGRAAMIARVHEWVRQGLMEAPEDFKDKLVVERNKQNPNRLDFIARPDLVNQFRVCGTLIQFLL
jgi:phage tail sheath gpL-like